MKRKMPVSEVPVIFISSPNFRDASPPRNPETQRKVKNYSSDVTVEFPKVTSAIA